MKYPHTPGSKTSGPSAEAAADMSSRASTLRALCLSALHDRPMTADEIAASLGETVLAIRPRVSELRRMLLVRDSGQRRKNNSGKSATVWTRATTELFEV